MATPGYWSRFSRREITRRRALLGAATIGVGAAALGAVGCGGDEKGTSGQQGQGQTGGKTPVAGGVQRNIWLGGSQFDSVDVHRAFRDEVQWLSNYVLSKVVRYENPDAGVIGGDLAERWETPDAQTYTFRIRRDVKWQETPLTKGRQLNAQDIKWHFERQAAGKLADGSEVPFRFQSIYKDSKVEATDDFTIKVTLPSVQADFLHTLAAFRSTVPNREATEAFEKDHNTLRTDAMPATGPFMIRQWRANEDVHIKKNPDHFRKGEPLLDGMILPIGLFADPAAARLAFEQKQIDSWGAPDTAVTLAILEANKGKMQEVLTGIANPVFLHLNMNTQFKDVRLVRAVNAAVDRRLMIQTFHAGLGQVSGPVTWIQDGWALKPEELVKYPGYRVTRDEDIREARQLWSAGGGPALGDVDIKSIDTWLGPYPDTQQFIVKMFNEALGVTQFKSTRGTYNDDVIPLLPRGTFANWLAWTSQVSTPDPRQGLFITFNSKGSGNYQNVRNAELDKLTADALATVDETKAKSLITQAQKIILDNGQYGNIMLYNYIGRSAFWNYYHPFLKDPGGPGKPASGWALFAGHLHAGRGWIDPSDPTYDPAIRNRAVV
ncbi:MAG TPA: ABC transporter substrate-binding protein [Dehalococcoidia bacterium]|nr:ABC transporter substrate-binding protein [Dehalococcoidia bacterium]